MEKGIDSYLKEQFEIPDVDIRTYSPLTLAYIGDGIYDLVIRSLVVAKGNTRASELHKRLKSGCLAVIRHRGIFCHSKRFGVAPPLIHGCLLLCI